MLSAETLQSLGLERDEAECLAAQVQSLASSGSPAECWHRITASALKPECPFEIHQYLRDCVFPEWGSQDAAVPLWSPSPQIIERSNLGKMMRRAGLADYPALHRWSVSKPEDFWKQTIGDLGIRFRTPPSSMLDSASDPRSPKWLPGAQLNITESCFKADSNATAIISGSASGQLASMTYGQLQTLANRVSNGLVQRGYVPGDAIAIDMDMRAETVAIYLGIIQAGCVCVSIAESFAPPEIGKRLDIAKTKAVFTTHCISRGGRILPIYEKVVQASPIPAIVLDAPGQVGTPPIALRTGDLSWHEFLGLSDETGCETHFQPIDRPGKMPVPHNVHVCSPGDWINILYSSGTTGDPKAIPWDHTTPIRCAADGYYHHDIHPGNVICWPTSLGWMMGPWLVFATMINSGTIALFDDVPTGKAFGEFVAAAGVNMLGVVPSLVRQWRATACMKGLDWSRIRAFSSTGECSNPDDMHYLMHLAGYRPIIEYCGGTEIGGGYITSTVVQPNAPSTFSGPAIGTDFIILDEEDAPADVGELFLHVPSLGLSPSLSNFDHHTVYFDEAPRDPEGKLLRRHGDQMQRLPGGYYRALGRADDTMNLGGIKVSSAEIERVLGRLPGVSDIAAIAAAPIGGGPSLLVIYAVTDGQSGRSAEAWMAIMQKAIREELNPLFRVADVQLVDKLPRTASNKVMRRELRAEYENVR